MSHTHLGCNMRESERDDDDDDDDDASLLCALNNFLGEGKITGFNNLQSKLMLLEFIVHKCVEESCFYSLLSK